ncbi:ABC transporter ATP-binding protein [Gulosibacter chungangensis]|uniref:ABC transporter ATP-binding protein n=1 Tax=Gulosibacter chungangensis TaxID=979746 RepID=A0A7J5B9C4_9MICO|nr:ABC transporter ATP-binding protein [Gulosibacter chungangensis]KAB1642175.1 ABC transporter ATP-binding protein [Gulosibacter chungangensis]
MSAGVTVDGLTKRFREVTAVDDISFEVPGGGVFAFLGTNGAGKSTTINCLTTVIQPDRGSLAVAGHDVATESDQVRQAIGVVFQESVLDDLLTVRENLYLRGLPYLGSKSNVTERLTALTEVIDLHELLDRRYGKLSGGQKRRVDIARALLHDPKILFLDEPTAGLDPGNRQLVWQTVQSLRERTGLTVFLTTHYMEETEQAQLVCIIDRGRIIAQGSPSELRAKHSASILTLTIDEGTKDIPVADAAEALRILGQETNVRDFEFRHGRMDDVFLNLTGSSILANDSDAKPDDPKEPADG